MSILALDTGMSHIGWAIMSGTASTPEIAALGVHSFPLSDTMDNGIPVMSAHKDRGIKRRARRRTQRLASKRRKAGHILRSFGYTEYAENVGYPERGTAFHTKVAPSVFAAVVRHIFNSPGYREMAEGEDEDDSATKKSRAEAGAAYQEYIDNGGSPGAYYASNPEARKFRLNRDICAELDRICTVQEVPDDLRQSLVSLCGFRRPLKSHVGLVGKCSQLAGEYRASKFAPSFQRFRLLTHIANLSIRVGPDAARQALTAEQKEVLLETPQNPLVTTTYSVSPRKIYGLPISSFRKRKTDRYESTLLTLLPV